MLLNVSLNSYEIYYSAFSNGIVANKNKYSSCNFFALDEL